MYNLIKNNKITFTFIVGVKSFHTNDKKCWTKIVTTIRTLRIICFDENSSEWYLLVLYFHRICFHIFSNIIDVTSWTQWVKSLHTPSKTIGGTACYLLYFLFFWLVEAINKLFTYLSWDYSPFLSTKIATMQFLLKVPFNKYHFLGLAIGFL